MKTMKKKAKEELGKFIKFECDQVASGFNINVIRKLKNGICVANRIARFGGEICERTEDLEFTEKMAKTLVAVFNANKAAYKRVEK